MPEKPVQPEAIPYDGHEHVICPPSEAYTITGTAAATSVGTYTFTASLKAGYVWGDGTTGDVTITWEITKPRLVVTAFEQIGWQLGERSEAPVLVVTAGEGGPEVTLTDDQVTYKYGTAETGPWSTDMPSSAGKWYVQAVIAGGADFDPPSEAPVASFTVWAAEASPIEELGYHALLTVGGYTGAELEGFPMLVRLTEEAMLGFRYDQVQVGGADLRFYAVDETGAVVLEDGVAKPLPYQIESWDPAGESIIWVKVPRYANGPVAMMCWGQVAGKALPANPPATEVWSAYSGVWHMSETIRAAEAATTKSLDSSASANDATPTKGNNGAADLSQMISVTGVVGNGRVNSATTASIQNGNRLLTKTAMALGSEFTFSGWYKMDVNSGYQRLVGNKNNNEAAGWSIETGNGSSTQLYIRGNSTASTIYDGQVDDLTADWVYLTFVFNGTEALLYSNGRYVGKATIEAIANTTRPLAFGSNSNGSEYSFIGALDELRISAGVQSADWILADYLQVRDGAVTFGPAIMTPEVTFQNHWLEAPSAGATEWGTGEEPLMNVGRPAYGTSYFVLTAIGGAAWTNDFPTAAGAYTLTFHADGGTTKPDGTWSWSDLATDPITVTVTAHSPRTDLSGTAGTATLSGRVLLANNEPGTASPILDQDYDQTADSSPTIYWVHEGVTSEYYDMLKPGSEHRLVAGSPVAELCGATNIWTLKDVYLGTPYTNLGIDDEKQRNYLPWSSTSAAKASDATYLVMRNIVDASITSPCYTNGIGTIYFDAVNGWVTGAGQDYNLVLEMVTGQQAMADAVANGAWQKVELRPLFRDLNVSPAFTESETTTELSLCATNGNQSVGSFYRVIAKIESHEPVRFRIRRVTAPDNTVFLLDQGGFILLDNIIVSYPAMRADLKAFGVFDVEKGGKQTLGYENAWNVPFPSVNDTVKARADVDFYTNPGDMAADTSTFVVSAKMHYRWRYLEQKIGSWKTVNLDPKTLKAPDALDLSDAAPVAAGEDGAAVLPGDIEFFYETVLNAPYYKFVDYAALPDFRMADFYSEEVPLVTNRYEGVALSSQGSDWFVRLREGKSDFEAFTLEIWTPDEDGEFVTAAPESEEEGEGGAGEGEAAERIPVGVKTVEMELIGNHIWRGYFQTLDPIPAGVKFRVQALNKQTPESTEWETNATLKALTEDVESLPVSGILRPGAESDWTALPVDAATGYLMFQLDDTTDSLTIVHADYQNFNGWNDANKGGLFVGSSVEDDEKAGTSPRATEWTETFDTWTDMPATNKHWQESFTTTVQLEYPDYTTFSSTATPNGWNAGQGMWVYGNYKDAATGRALQMEGQGRGYLQFLDAAEAPRGLESVSFKARLGQFVNFSDFSYSLADNMMSMSNYTFTTRAAFDLNSNKNFSGNASLSLIAYYHPGKGCYEFRYEQALASIASNGSVSGPLKQGQVYSLYRWAYDKTTGRMNKTHLGSITNSATFKTDAITTSGTGGNYTPMYLSVSNDPSGTVCIMAGTMRTGMAPSAALTSMTSGSFDSLCYRDTSASKLTSGTYGVLSANCDGVFLCPFRLRSPVPFSTNFTTNNKLDRYSNSTITIDVTNPYQCAQDIADENWFVTPGRMEGFNEGGNQWGLRAKTPVQTLNIYTATAGKTDWKLIASTNFNSFGTAKACTFNLYTTKDCSVKIAAAGTSDDLRTDLIVDDVELRQWRGDTWYNEDEMHEYIPNWMSEDNYKAHTNIIFTSAWIKDKGLLLSAKRTEPGTPCSIRSPLFDGAYGRGTGLGMFSFSYANAQPNVKLQLQVATNVTYDTVNMLNTLEPGSWTTVTNFTFESSSSGTRSCYIGMHGVKGVMRLLMDPSVVEAAAVSGDPKYGEILITEVYCRDEPTLDTGCWWGWNLRTLGPDASGKDSEARMYLPDLTTVPSKLGQSLALNNSVTEDTDGRDGQTYVQHQPFVQTPTFTSNVVGEVTFRARKYDGSASSQPAQVTLYGSVGGATGSEWKRLTYFAVSNTTYSTYSFKTEPGESYNAFRLAVTGVAGVTDTKVDNRSPEGYDEPVRVLIDEVLVSEAVRARVAFKNVGPFRTDLSSKGYVAGVPSEAQQPLCNESWGIECEVYAAQLPDEIDFSRQPVVRLYWYPNDYPWGFANWKDAPGAKSALLAPATGTNLVFRSSYVTAPDAVIAPSTAPGSVVQYMLEVSYYQVGASVVMTNYLSSTDWTNPAWYKPVDKNAGEPAFAAYTILDTVAPHWAWINEVNVFGEYDYNYNNSDADEQYVEIAVPAEADITGWKVEMVEGNSNTGVVITNTLGIFGARDLAPTKEYGESYSNMVFRVLGNPASRKGGKLKYEDGTLDGVWNISNPTTILSSGGELSGMDPVGLRLVRASGIVEHEIVTLGTNWWAQDEFYSAYFHPTNTVNLLNANMKGSDFLYVGNDDGGLLASIGVVNEKGGTSNVWSKAMIHTPGKINEGQYIDPDHPTPNGSSIIIYANLDTAAGHIYQTLGDAVNTNRNQILVIQKGSDRGTNITYRVDPWYEIGTVTTNGRPAVARALGEPRTYEVTVGVGASNNVTVVASAKVQQNLVDLGLTDDNRYRDAVVDWLLKHKDAYGNDWANPDSEEVRLADVIGLNDDYLSTMTLTEMYWLDMDPTIGNLALKGGMAEAPQPIVRETTYSIIEQGVEKTWTTVDTNVTMGVHLEITNRVEDAADPRYGQAWAPYVMRGMAPGETSWQYAASGSSWTNATFNIAGILSNGLTHESNRDNWIPLRWFVFLPDSFDDDFVSRIEIKDPFGTESPGYSAGWYDWVQVHGPTPVFYRWAIDTRRKPFNVELLKKENYYE